MKIFNKNVLVIDHNPDVFSTYQSFLSEEGVADDSELGEGYQLDFVKSGQEAVDKIGRARAADHAYTVVFIDLHLSGWDGVKTAQAIRGLDKDVAIVLVTALQDTSQEDIQTELGFEIYLLHLPLDGALLRGVTQNLCSGWNYAQERREAERALRDTEARVGVMLETALDCIITIDQDSEVVDFNMMAEKTFGIPRYVITGKEITDFIIPYDQREAHQRGMMRYLERGESNILNMRIEMTAMRSDESLFPVEMAIAPIFHSGDKKMFTAYLRDITERKEMLLQLAHQSSHDALTGLYNRRKFEDCLGDALKTAETEEKNHVLCLMDLDRFKVVNDTGGHLAGDDLLRKLTAKLQENVRETDILARLGGDEFGLIMMNASIDEGYDMGEKIRHLINNLGFEWEGKAFDVGVSVGLTEMNKHVDLEHSAVITRADLACYAAKSRGRDLVVVYRDDDEEQNRSFAEMQVVADVKEALEHDNFRLYCQEISPLDDNIEDLHYEILVRMVDGEGKMIPPGLFIPACEKYNLMPQLDRWVIGNAYRFFNEQFKSEPNWERMVFSINLSGNSLTDHSLLDFVREELETHQIPPKNICFEITETAAIDDINTAESFINQMREIGCQFALDDFGSGFSSFGYLKKLKVDFLKIDGQFVRDIAHDPVDYAMVEAINRIGHAVGIRTVAEYVEDMEIMGHLRDIGVDFAQGYAIDKPGPIEDLLKKKRD